jgi:hypothetical protein
MKWGHLAAAMACALLCGFSGVGNAQQGNANANAEGADDQAKFFVFHGQGVTFEQARADYYYCISQAQPIISLRDRMGDSGGLLGALINGRMAEIDRLRMRNAAMRQCMHLIGYDRYRMPQAAWNAMVNEGDIVLSNAHQVDPVVVDRLAHFASGPTPTTERLDP